MKFAKVMCSCCRMCWLDIVLQVNTLPSRNERYVIEKVASVMFVIDLTVDCYLCPTILKCLIHAHLSNQSVHHYVYTNLRGTVHISANVYKITYVIEYTGSPYNQLSW